MLVVTRFASVQQALAKRLRDQVPAVVRSAFLQHHANVILDGVDRNAELRGNRPVLGTSAQLFQDFRLLRRELHRDAPTC